MKIVIDARVINSSTGRYVERMLTHLETIDNVNEYTVLVPSKDVDYWKPTNKNFSVVISDYVNYSFGEQIGFCIQLYRLRADLVHFCMPQQPILYLRPHVTAILDLTLLQIHPRFKNKVIFSFKQFIGRFVFFVIGHLSKRVLTISDYTKDQYAQYAHIPKSKITTTYLAADILITDEKEPESVANGTKYLLFVGQQNEHKNVPRLVNAHQKLLLTHPDLQLVFAGKIKDDVLENQKWIESESFKNIIFTDFISNDELGRLYRHAAICVIPSLIEGFGLPGLEAMKHECPVASSNTACLPEIYGDGAVYFDPYDRDEMASVIDSILVNQNLRSDLIQRGIANADKYSWEKMAQQTKAVYDLALSE